MPRMEPTEKSHGDINSPLSVQTRRLSPLLPYQIDRSSISSSTTNENPIDIDFVATGPFKQATPKYCQELKPRFQRGKATASKFKPTVNKPVRYRHIESDGEHPKPVEFVSIYDSKIAAKTAGGKKQKAPLTINDIYSKHMDAHAKR